MVTRTYRFDACAHRFDDSGPLVPEHGWKRHLIGAVDDVLIRVADAARLQPHEHLTASGRRQFELLDGDLEFVAGAIEYRCADLHGLLAFRPVAVSVNAQHPTSIRT